MVLEITDFAVDVLRYGSVVVFCGVTGFFVFLLLIPRDRLRAYLSKTAIRRFVEYFGNVDLGNEASGATETHSGRHKIVGRA